MTSSSREAELAFAADDNNLALWFTPDAIREHFEEDVVGAASEETLRLAALNALNSDLLYEAFHQALVFGLEQEGIVT